ncbi:MAG: GNAT family N-acetyltransferase [Bacteroidota bacterium]
MEIKLRKAVKTDIPEILKLIKELALYERAPLEVSVTETDLETDGFGQNPIFYVIMAYADEMVAGMAFYYFSYSSWKGKCLYLEDIIVKEHLRGNKIGKILFDKVIQIAKKTNAKRMHWQVLDWNEPAINFYKKYDAILDSSWVNGKLTHEQLQKL